ncbi:MULTISPECIES: hypothetical protein [Mycolicibacterium]|uniref:hypothetical protein n=1 Tax=Mycolicibacterium TaxID=1866885 RepID=UPI000B2A6887|nr:MULTISPECIES: hypothetical protein [Mycolicibacterium]MCW1820804.1 hypothetical protein [Mycolicibacterium senegalense]
MTEDEARAYIESRRTEAGGWTRAQLAEWGVAWPPPKGWKADLAARLAARAAGEA